MDQKEKIFIIDDSQLNLVYLKRFLQNDYELTTAESGEEGLAKLQDGYSPDLILLDIMMPGIDGYEVCRRLKKDETTKKIPVIFLTALDTKENEELGLEVGAVDYITKPISKAILTTRVRNYLSLSELNHELEEKVKKRTLELEESKKALQLSLKNLQTSKVSAGVFWVQVPEAGVYILCGCPADVVKHLMRKGFIASTTEGSVTFETGPNVILLSDVLIQNGKFANLSEFPVLQLLYRQGLILPNHPNNTGKKPMIIGLKEQVEAQMDYLYRGNYGLVSKEEIMETGIPEEEAEEMMRIKMKFAFGKIKKSEELIDSRYVDTEFVEIQNGVFVRNVGFNRYEFQYKDKTSEVNLNLERNEAYESPYSLGFHKIKREYFGVIHSGEGDGWNVNKQTFGSILMFQGDIYLIDASPNIFHSLRSFGIDISEIKGIFHTHAHDDHFAGLPTLMQSDHRIKYFSTPLVRASAAKKLSALMSLDVCKFTDFFDVQDLDFDKWNDCDGLEVKPIYSPHPVETNIFLFRTVDPDGYKTYAHWADIVSLDLLKNMTGDKAGDISLKTYGKVKENYLQKVDLKKLDVGGGMIHGVASDFRNDKSKSLILAHFSTELSDEQKEIGSEAAFGAVDALIPGNQDYTMKQAFRYISNFLPNVKRSDLSSLLNSPVVEFNVGTIIQKKGEHPKDFYILLTGSVEFVHSETNVKTGLSVGSFIGEEAVITGNITNGTWRAESYVQLLKISSKMMHSFLKKRGLLKEVQTTMEHVRFLHSSWLFGGENSYANQNRIARIMKEKELDAGEILKQETSPSLFLVLEGEITLSNGNGKDIDVLKSGDFFGEESYFTQEKGFFTFQAVRKTTIIVIAHFPLLDIPVVHLKMLETYEKRKRL